MDPISIAVNLLGSGIAFFHNVVPGGFGLLLVPLMVFGLATTWAARRS